MRIPLNIVSVFLFVTVGALIGMVMGGLFGYAAGLIGPDLFVRLGLWERFEPVGVATVIGAFGGVFCGAALAGFAVFVQLFTSWSGRKQIQET